MVITLDSVFEKLREYMNRSITVDELADWALNAILVYEFEGKNYEAIRNILCRLGLANIKSYGITWDDCKNYFSILGYKVNIQYEHDFVA